MTTTTYLPDTNLLLQCRQPGECPWSDLTATDDIRLVVVPEVRRELDRHKNGPSSRRSRRAREWISQFRKARQGDRTILLRQTSPKIVMLLAPIVPLPEDMTGLLDGETGDTRVVREALAWRAGNPGCEARLLTDDGGAAELAEAVGLGAVEIPLEEEGKPRRWRLDPEPDTKEKEIRDLRARVEGLEAVRPAMEAGFVDGEGREIERLDVALAHYPPLSQADQDDLLTAILRRWPAETDFRIEPPVAPPTRAGSLAGLTAGIATMLQQWRPPDQRAIDRYQQEGRPGWEEAVRKLLRLLHRRLEVTSTLPGFGVRLWNPGRATANNVSVVLTASPGLGIVKLDEEEAGFAAHQPTVPSPPTPPRGRYVSLGDGLAALGQVAASPPRIDFSPVRSPAPDDLVWRDRPNHPTTRCELACGEFRHRSEPRRVALHVAVLADAARPISGAVSVVVHATNQPEPLRRVLPARGTWETRDTVAAAQELLSREPADLPAEIRSVLTKIAVARRKLREAPGS